MKTDKEKKVIVRLIKNTDTHNTNRISDIWQIACDIEWLRTKYDNLKTASELVGISTDMLRRFLSVRELETEIIKLVKSRKIDSVFAVHYLKGFNRADQLKIGKECAEGNLNSHDIRVLAPLRKKFPSVRIDDLIEQVLNSKKKKMYLAYFDISGKSQIENIKNRLNKVVGFDLFEIEEEGTVGVVKISERGMINLRNGAKQIETIWKRYYRKKNL